MLKPWSQKMVLQRVQTLMMRNYYNFQYLWNFGEVTLLLARTKNIGCKSPRGDWKTFASLHFSDLMTISFLSAAPPLPEYPRAPEPEYIPEEGEEGELNIDDIDEFNLDDLDLK